MLDPQIWNTIRFNSEEDWGQFVSFNLTSHDALEAALATANGTTYVRVPFYTVSSADQLAHWQEHVTIANLQGTRVPDISELSFDPQNEQGFYDFLSAHAFYHQTQENAAGVS
ncbi:MAG: hypothetical protein ACRD52_00685 [Candidatus Acidiferrales bacterium]